MKEIYFFLPAIFILGLITSYEDIKFGKIRNKLVLLAILYALIVNFILFSLNIYNLSYFHVFLVNISMALGLGILIWLLGFWTAGDAKLFFAYFLLIPLNTYSYRFLNIFPWLQILFYAFVPFAIFIAINTLFKIVSENKLHDLRSVLNPYDLIKSAVFVFAFLWIARLLLTYLNTGYSTILSVVLLLLIAPFVDYLDNRVFVASLLIGFFRLISDTSVYSSTYLLRFLYVLMAFVLLRILLKLSYLYFTKKVKISSLEVGMVPAENIEILGKKHKKTASSYSLKKPTHALFKSSPAGLSIDDINAIKKAAKQFRIKDILVYQTISFSPFLFISVMIIVFFALYF